MYCANCGNQVSESNSFCPACGSGINQAPPSASPDTGLRGFSQALRRELADTGVAVVHLAPRAIATPLNTAAVDALNRELGHRSDRAEDVAEAIVAALRRGSHERHLGFPERLFARLNGIAPSLIDRGVAGKLAAIKRHAAAG